MLLQSQKTPMIIWKMLLRWSVTTCRYQRIKQACEYVYIFWDGLMFIIGLTKGEISSDLYFKSKFGYSWFFFVLHINFGISHITDEHVCVYSKISSQIWKCSWIYWKSTYYINHFLIWKRFSMHFELDTDALFNLLRIIIHSTRWQGTTPKFTYDRNWMHAYAETKKFH